MERDTNINGKKGDLQNHGIGDKRERTLEK